MNGNKRERGGEKKAATRAVPPAGSGDDDAGATPAPARKTPLPDAADGELPVEVSGGGGEQEVDNDDDEQVERFYALLANIRAMRGLLPPYASCVGGAGDAGSRKRLRAAEPPWRPAFRMEDFEVEPAATAPSQRNQITEGADAAADGESASGARPDVNDAPPPPHAAVRSDSGSYKD